jgi:hypothetical protein
MTFKNVKNYGEVKQSGSFVVTLKDELDNTIEKVITF